MSTPQEIREVTDLFLLHKAGGLDESEFAAAKAAIGVEGRQPAAADPRVVAPSKLQKGGLLEMFGKKDFEDSANSKQFDFMEQPDFLESIDSRPGRDFADVLVEHTYDHEVGDTVEAFFDSEWLLGQVSGLGRFKGGMRTYDVTWADDGTTSADLHPALIRDLGKFSKGQRVKACFDDEWHPATISRLGGDPGGEHLYDVLWDDGTATDGLSESELRA